MVCDVISHQHGTSVTSVTTIVVIVSISALLLSEHHLYSMHWKINIWVIILPSSSSLVMVINKVRSMLPANLIDRLMS